ncbi:MAG: phosphotriesterase-related protein [Propionibacteriaceae bacterium]|jgi:predicted metal-dependent phosphotriesterase family hydrolase|nr:aryldialkylphosphatase [Propionibacteriaceae bacterium]MDX6321810.1 phosphotriesterase-related protein [Propionibacteriaceae bacterium]
MFAGKVVTVLGEIEPSEMGNTLTHDHLLVDGWGLRNLYEAILDDEGIAIDEVRRFKEAGGGTICDPTNIGLGRDPRALARLSAATGVHVVMGAGWYREVVYPDYISSTSTEVLAQILVNEIRDGVDGTGIRPGFIGEIGTERGHITPAVERVFRAAARAHVRTGIPILTHTTHWGELALEQLDLLAEEGVAPSVVIVSHLGDRKGVANILPIAERGAWINVDNIGFVGGYAPLEFRADNVAELCSLGLADRVMLSNDICELGQLSAYGGAGYANVILNFLPLLRDRGVSEDHIQQMMVLNPSLAFAFTEPADAATVVQP